MNTDSKLLEYYNRFFPFDLLYQWLSYGSDSLFSKREFAFWNSSNFFIRYQSFKNLEEFRLMLSRPLESIHGNLVIERMEIGPIYRKPPKNHLIPGTVPVAKEFVIDIDINDYNAVRTCCRDASVCSSCWIVMTIAIKVIDLLLRREFGFNHLLWVFSGRRGVHCWVCDESAKKLNSEERAAVIRHMTLPKYPFTPLMRDIYQDILLKYFETWVLPKQKILEFPTMQENVFKRIPKSVSSVLKTAWMDDTNGSVYRWSELKKTYKAADFFCFSSKIAEIVLEHTYPRFDVKVSEDLNHLLKSPFCVHPKSGFVSIPIDPKNCESFDPLNSAPSLQGLIDRNPRDLSLFQTSIDYFKHSFINSFII